MHKLPLVSIYDQEETFSLSSQDEHVRVSFLYEMLLPLSFSHGNDTVRTTQCRSRFLVLNALYQLNKNVISTKWIVNFISEKKLAKMSGYSLRTLKSVINHPIFSQMCEIERRPGTTNVYRLKKWVVEIFHFFEAKGMMKNVITNFDKWKQIFLKRIRTWLMPLLHKGYTLAQILMNKLSTKKELKLHDPNELKLHDPIIKHSDSSYEAQRGYKTKPSPPNLPILKDYEEIMEVLSSSFEMKEGDIHHFFKFYSPYVLKKAAKKAKLWLSTSVPNSPARMFQSLVNSVVKG